MAAMWLSIFMPFEHAKAFMTYCMSMPVSETCLKETSYRMGSKLYNDAMKDGRRPESIPRPSEIIKRMYIQADGSMVPIRGEEKRDFKEVKLGLVYTEDDIVQKKTRNGDTRSEIRNKHFASSIGEGVDPFKKMLKARAIRKGYYQASEVILLSDGASWIDKMKEEQFPDAVHILDWYHAMDHLWQAAMVLFGEANVKACEEWVFPLKEKLWEGQVENVINILEAEILSRNKRKQALIELRGYFISNKHKMKYKEYRDRGYYIGSGAIESAHKYVIASRLKMAGMRWSLSHANAMIWLRSKYFEDSWIDFWHHLSLTEYMVNPGNTHEVGIAA
jgi:hypothetical protein